MPVVKNQHLKNIEHVVIFCNCHKTPIFLQNGNYFRSNTKNRNVLPCYWIHGYCLRIVKLQINQGDTHRPIVIANKDPVTDMVHKVEISGEPVNRHVFHICKTHTQNHWCKSRIMSRSVHRSAQTIPEDILEI